MATIVASSTTTNWATQSTATGMRWGVPRRLLPSNDGMEVTDWTAGTMRLDGGHPALELVNTIYGQVGQPPEHDVLAAPEDVVVFARRIGLIADAVPSR